MNCRRADTCYVLYLFHSLDYAEVSIRFGVNHGDIDHYGKGKPGEGPPRRLRRAVWTDPACGRPSAAACGAQGGQREWKQWSCVVLKPDGLYPTRASPEGNKPAKLKAIAAALKSCDDVILATDCDREGQLIGQEILDHLGYRGRVRRALFTAQDPKTLQQAFARLKPNQEMRPLYEAAVARQQADQIFKLLH